MARYNEILVGRFARAVQKLFGIKGEVPIGSLSGEMVVMHPFASGNENRYLEGWSLYGAGMRVTAVAAQNSAAQIRNPAGSNVMVVITKISIEEDGVAQDVITVRHGADPGSNLGTVVSNLEMDGRGGRQASTAVVSQGNNLVPITSQIAAVAALAATTLDIILDESQSIPLPPGKALQVVTNTVNEAATFTFFWRERFLEESERT